VRLGVEHQESGGTSNSEEDSSNNDYSDGPGRQQSVNVDNSLLISVREVVVSSAHVVEGSGEIHLEASSIEVLGSSVQQSAVSDIFVGLSSGLGLLELSLSLASSLVKVLHSESDFGILEEDLLLVRLSPLFGGRDGSPGVLDLSNVGSIGLRGSFSGVSSWVLVASSPLEVNVISDSDVKILRNEVVFGGGVGLDDVSSLSSDVQVVQSRSSGNLAGSLGDNEGVRSILEGSSKLSGINGHLNFVRHSGSGVSLVEDRVFLDDGRFSVVGPVDKLGIGSRHIRESIFDGRDVVSQSDNANADRRSLGSLVNAVELLHVLERREGHVVSVLESISSVS